MRTLIALFVALALSSLSACSPRRAIEAAILIGDIAARAEPSALKRRTPEPVRSTVTYAVGNRRYVADIYRPGGGEKAVAAAIFVPGVVRAGKDDPRLVDFAMSFARVRFLVFVPDIPNLRALRISATDAHAIADAMRHLAAAGGFEGARPIGLFAFSYAAGPTLIAAMEPDTRHLVRFIYTVGAYHSIELPSPISRRGAIASGRTALGAKRDLILMRSGCSCSATPGALRIPLIAWC